MTEASMNSNEEATREVNEVTDSSASVAAAVEPGLCISDL